MWFTSQVIVQTDYSKMLAFIRLHGEEWLTAIWIIDKHPACLTVRFYLLHRFLLAINSAREHSNTRDASNSCLLMCKFPVIWIALLKCQRCYFVWLQSAIHRYCWQFARSQFLFIDVCMFYQKAVVQTNQHHKRESNLPVNYSELFRLYRCVINILKDFLNKYI